MGGPSSRRSAAFVARRALLGASVLPVAPIAVGLGLGVGPGRAVRAQTSASASALAPTPRQSRGPFYPPDPPRDAGNDLIVERDGRRAQGEITRLSGRVLDTTGRPVAGTLVEIWQCNAAGRYHHPRDDGPAPIDPLFRAYGRATTDAEGRWSFRTIRPMPYPGRTPHIHLQASSPDGVELVTQVYVRGEPGNARDGLLRRLPPEDRERLAADFVRTADGGWRATFEVVLPA